MTGSSVRRGGDLTTYGCASCRTGIGALSPGSRLALATEGLLGLRIGGTFPQMRRYAAFLRGVSPMNAKMPELKKAFEAAGFEDVKTVISSGNVVFGARAASEASIQKKAEAAMEKRLGHSFLTIVRPVDMLREMLASDLYKPFGLPSNAKRIVTFLRETPTEKLELPIEMSGASILLMKGREIFSAYLPTSEGPVFMTLIEKTFGKAVTTRTWDTVTKVAR